MDYGISSLSHVVYLRVSAQSGKLELQALENLFGGILRAKALRTRRFLEEIVVEPFGLYIYISRQGLPNFW